MKVKFKNYGLNKYKNFMFAPECDCGCGGKLQPMFESKDELFSFAAHVLEEHDCNYCAIFIDALDGKYAVIKNTKGEFDDWEEGMLHGASDDDNGPVEIVGIDTPTFTDSDGDVYPANEFFQMLDGDMQLHCYGFLHEVDSGVFEIVEE